MPRKPDPEKVHLKRIADALNKAAPGSVTQQKLITEEGLTLQRMNEREIAACHNQLQAKQDLLDKALADLQSVTANRDALQGQVETMQRDVSKLKSRVSSADKWDLQEKAKADAQREAERKEREEKAQADRVAARVSLQKSLRDEFEARTKSMDLFGLTAELTKCETTLEFDLDRSWFSTNTICDISYAISLYREYLCSRLNKACPPLKGS